MGLTKRLWEESIEKGYVAPQDHFVCGECVVSEILKAILDDASTEQECSYCESAMAAPIEVLLNEISDAAFAGYTDPAHELPYERREGGYQGEVLESHDLIEELGEWTHSDALYEDVSAAFGDSVWCRTNYFGLDAESRLRYGWSDFVRQIKHKTRYLFLQEEREDDYGESIPPSRMLDEVGGLLGTLVKRIPEGLVTYRARVVAANDRPQTAGELGTPPAALAQLDNRMSPAGIPMFYAAIDDETAVAETFDPQMGQERNIAIGRWRAMRELVVLDLTQLPEVPDPFDSASRMDRPMVEFVHEFVDELTKPVDRAMSSIDYVPTQVVTEYVRHRMTSEDGAGIDAIKYRSSKCADGIAVVVFAERDNCLGLGEREWHHDPQLLELCDVQHHDPSDFDHLWEIPDEG